MRWQKVAQDCCSFLFPRSWAVPPSDDINRFNWFQLVVFLRDTEPYRTTGNSQGFNVWTTSGDPAASFAVGPVLEIDFSVISLVGFLRGHLTDFSRKRRLSGLVSHRWGAMWNLDCVKFCASYLAWRVPTRHCQILPNLLSFCWCTMYAKLNGSKDWEDIFFLGQISWSRNTVEFFYIKLCGFGRSFVGDQWLSMTFHPQETYLSSNTHTTNVRRLGHNLQQETSSRQTNLLNWLIGGFRYAMLWRWSQHHLSTWDGWIFDCKISMSIVSSKTGADIPRIAGSPFWLVHWMNMVTRWHRRQAAALWGDFNFLPALIASKQCLDQKHSCYGLLWYHLGGSNLLHYWLVDHEWLLPENPTIGAGDFRFSEGFSFEILSSALPLQKKVRNLPASAYALALTALEVKCCTEKKMRRKLLLKRNKSMIHV